MKPTPHLKWFAAAMLAVTLTACPPQPEPKPPTTDTTPDPVTFTPITGAELSTVTESEQVTISGINATAAVSITGGEYRIGAGAYTNAAGAITSGQKLQLRTTSPNALNTAKDVQVTVGTSNFTFSVTTKTAPGDVSFATKIDQPWGTATESNAVALSSINPNTPITVSGGSYKINAGAYTTSAGTINNGDIVTVKGTTASADLTETTVTLTIGAQARSFTIKTGKRIPDALNPTLTNRADADPGASIAQSFTVSGITIPTPITVTNGTFTVNGAARTSPGTLNNNDLVAVTTTAPNTADGSSSPTVGVTIGRDGLNPSGGLVGSFAVSTKDWNPAISFTPQTDATPSVSAGERYWTGTTRCTFPIAPGSVCDGLSGDARYQQPPLAVEATFIQSNTVTLSSISPNTPVSVQGGEYSKNGGAFTASAGTVNAGDTLQVRLSAIYPGATNAASLSFGTVIGGATSTFVKPFNVTTSSATVQNVWTANAASAPITIPSGGVATATITVPTTTAKIAKVRVLVTLEGNNFKRSAHVISLIAPGGGQTLALMDFVNSKPAGNGLPVGVNPLDPRLLGSAPADVNVPLKTGTVAEKPWPWNALDFINYGGGGGVNAIFDSSNFGLDATAPSYTNDSTVVGTGTDTTLDGGANRNDVYRRCGTDFYAVQKKKYIAFDLQAGQTQTNIDNLNAALNRDLPRAGTIDPYTGKADTRGGTSAAPNSPIVTGEYTDGTCSRNTGNVYYPPIAPDPRVGNLASLNNLNPSGVWTLQVRQNEAGASPITITAFKLIFNFKP